MPKRIILSKPKTSFADEVAEIERHIKAIEAKPDKVKVADELVFIMRMMQGMMTDAKKTKKSSLVE